MRHEEVDLMKKMFNKSCSTSSKTPYRVQSDLSYNLRVESYDFWRQPGHRLRKKRLGTCEAGVPIPYNLYLPEVMIWIRWVCLYWQQNQSKIWLPCRHMMQCKQSQALLCLHNKSHFHFCCHMNCSWLFLIILD